MSRVHTFMRLSAHTRKLIGTVLTLVWIAVYALLAMGVGVRVLPHAAWPVTLLFYALAGTIWIIPVGLLLPWMHREPAARE